jgi:hypothetical protein
MMAADYRYILKIGRKVGIGTSAMQRVAVQAAEQ